MFNDLIIRDGSVHNLVISGMTIGFTFDSSIAYYRGLGLSMVETPRILIDGEAVNTANIRFCYRELVWTFEELANETSIRWELGDRATIIVLRPGGLAAGVHELSVTQVLRISYLPIKSESTFTREVTIS